MRYSIKPRDICIYVYVYIYIYIYIYRCKIYVNEYGFLSFDKNMGKSLSSKHGQKLLDSAKKIYYRCNKNSFKKSNSKNCRSNWRLKIK